MSTNSALSPSSHFNSHPIGLRPLTIIAVCVGALLLCSSPARAALKTQRINYKQGDVNLQGFLAYDDAVQGKRPGVLVVHEWWGNNQYSQSRAEQLARLGYVAFALDMYGKGVEANTPEEAQKLATPFFKDRAAMRARAMAGLEVLKQQPQCDPTKIAAIGYCFGGTTALELARGGADLVGVCSFHGVLANPNPEDAKNIKGKVLVQTGGDDPMVPPEQVQAFEEEMRKADKDWEVVVYGHAVHAFTNPNADSHHMKGVGYNAEADKRSWGAMVSFFNEIFGPSPAPAMPRPAAGRRSDAGSQPPSPPTESGSDRKG